MNNLNAQFFEDGKYLKEISEQFAELSQNRTYQYYDLQAGNRRLTIKQMATNPFHQDRWRMCISPPDEQLFKGASVLEIGGAEGFYCLKSSLLGAETVTMLELNDKRCACAQLIFEFFNIDNISIYQKTLQELTPKELGEYDISLLMRIVHYWFVPYHQTYGTGGVDTETGKYLLNLILEHTKKLCVINSDKECVEEIPSYVNDKNLRFNFGEFKHSDRNYEKFMGCLKIWK